MNHLNKLIRLINILNDINEKALAGNVEAEELKRVRLWVRPEEDGTVSIICDNEPMMQGVGIVNAIVGTTAQVMFAKIQAVVIDLNNNGVPTALLPHPPFPGEQWPRFTIVMTNGKGKPIAPVTKDKSPNLKYSEALSHLKRSQRLMYEAQAKNATMH